MLDLPPTPSAPREVFAAALADLPAPAAIIGPEGAILWGNDALHDVLGFGRSELQGQSLPELAIDAAPARSLLVRLSRLETVADLELGLRARDGSARYLIVNASPINSGNGELHAARMFGFDVTHRKRTELRASQVQAGAVALAEATSEREAAELVVRLLRVAFNAPRIGLWTLHDGALALSFAAGFSEETLRNFDRIPIRAPMSMPITDAVQRCEPVWIETRETLCEHYPQFGATVAHALPEYAVACLPLVAGDCLGVMALMFNHSRTFAPEERDFAAMLLRHGAHAILRSRVTALHRDAQEINQLARSRLRLLAESAESYARAGLDQKRIAEALAATIAELLGDVCSIRLFNEEGVETLAAWDRDPDGLQALLAAVQAGPVRRDKGSLAMFEASPGGVFFPRLDVAQFNAGVQDEFREFVRRFPIHSLMVLPIRAHGELIGALTLGRHRAEPAYELEDRAVAQEIADRAALALSNARHHERLIRERKLLEAVLEQMPSAVVVVDAVSKRIILANDQNAKILGAPVDRFAESNLIAFRPDGERVAEEEWPVMRTLRSGQGVRGEELRIVRPGGTSTVVRVSVAPVRDEASRLVAVVASYEDITEAKLAAERASFIARATELLGETLDYQKTLVAVANLAVPRLADWCAIEVLNRDGSSEQLAVAHVDPKKVELAHDLRRRYPPHPDQPTGVRNVMRTGVAELYPEIPDELLVRSARDEEHLRIARQLGLRSLIIVPIAARGKVYGAISLVSSESRRVFDSADLQLAEQLADRAAVAIENAALYEEARRAIRIRDDFLSVASHELKTPLTSLDLLVSSLVDKAEQHRLGDLPLERLEDRLFRAHEQIRRLERLINELLDVSRIHGGRLELTPQHVDLASMAKEVVDRFDAEAVQKGSTIALQANEAAWGHWDPARLDQLITNLLSNALKYGAGKPITVRVEKNPSHARLIVEDGGIGIAPEDQQRIFDRFERAATARNYGGLGLGLWIVRQIAEAHGGETSVSSRLGEGSIFTVDLPLRPANESV